MFHSTNQGKNQTPNGKAKRNSRAKAINCDDDLAVTSPPGRPKDGSGSLDVVTGPVPLQDYLQVGHYKQAVI